VILISYNIENGPALSL